MAGSSTAPIETPNLAYTRFARKNETTNEVAVIAADRMPNAVARSASSGNVAAALIVNGYWTEKPRIASRMYATAIRRSRGDVATTSKPARTSAVIDWRVRARRAGR